MVVVPPPCVVHGGGLYSFFVSFLWQQQQPDYPTPLHFAYGVDFLFFFFPFFVFFSGHYPPPTFIVCWGGFLFFNGCYLSHLHCALGGLMFFFFLMVINPPLALWGAMFFFFFNGHYPLPGSHYVFVFLKGHHPSHLCYALGGLMFFFFLMVITPPLTLCIVGGLCFNGYYPSQSCCALGKAYVFVFLKMVVTPPLALCIGRVYVFLFHFLFHSYYLVAPPSCTVHWGSFFVFVNSITLIIYLLNTYHSLLLVSSALSHYDYYNVYMYKVLFYFISSFISKLLAYAIWKSKMEAFEAATKQATPQTYRGKTVQYLYITYISTQRKEIVSKEKITKSLEQVYTPAWLLSPQTPNLPTMVVSINARPHLMIMVSLSKLTKRRLQFCRHKKHQKLHLPQNC